MGARWGRRSRGDGACVGVWRFGVLIPFLRVEALQVSQEPAELRVAAGTNASLQCRLLAARPWSLARVVWLKAGGHEELCAARLHPGAATVPCANPCLHLTWSAPHANLSIHGAQEGDAGCYVCHVTIEVPYLAMAARNGSLLHVGTGAEGAELMWKLGGAVGGTVLLVGLIGLGYWRCRRRADPSHIYINFVPRGTPRNKSPHGAAAGGQSVRGELDRAWKPPSPKG